MVTLTRVQSGVGALTIHAVCPNSVGDLTVGCAYQLASGQSSMVHHAKGLRVAPPGSKRPVIAAGGQGFGTLSLDLVQSREIVRLIVCAYSESGASLRWDGALVVQTYGGDRVEVPLRHEPAAGVLVPLSLFNIDGELVLRSEQSMLGGTLREATGAFGFELIRWLDDNTALT